MAANKPRKLNRDLWMIGLPSALLVGGAFTLTLLFMRPAPPSEITMSTGPGDGAYHGYATRYRDILARHGVTLRLWPSAGAVENLHRLADPAAGVDVALVQGGVVSAEPAKDSHGLTSLGSVYYEPLWVFYRGEQEIDRLPPLAGKRIAIGADKSGTAALSTLLLDSSGIKPPDTVIMKIGGRAAAQLLLSGGIDSAFFVADPLAPIIQELLRAKGVRLMSFARADAYVRRHFYLTKLSLPPDVMDLQQSIPPREVLLVGATANLVVRKDLHPALAYLLLQAAAEVHGPPTLFSTLRQFPAPNDTELPLSPDAARFYKSGPPFLQRYLPYWAAVLVDRLLVLLLPALVVLIPAFRLLPQLYRWRVRSRIYRWYAKLKEIELELEERRSQEQLEAILPRLDEIEDAVNHIDTPLAYSENLYAFRQHIDLVRERARSRVLRPMRDVDRLGARHAEAGLGQSTSATP